MLDCSVALAWVLLVKDNDATDLIADRLDRESVYVPSTWSLEVGNALFGAQGRVRLTESEQIRLAGDMAVLPVEVAPDSGAAAFGDVLHLARERGLTTFDAVYLELQAPIRRAGHPRYSAPPDVLDPEKILLPHDEVRVHLEPPRSKTANEHLAFGALRTRAPAAGRVPRRQPSPHAGA